MARLLSRSRKSRKQEVAEIGGEAEGMDLFHVKQRVPSADRKVFHVKQVMNEELS